MHKLFTLCRDAEKGMEEETYEEIDELKANHEKVSTTSIPTYKQLVNVFSSLAKKWASLNNLKI